MLSALLETLARRPTQSAVEPATKCLTHPDLGDRAADVLWAVLKVSHSYGQHDRILNQVREVASQHKSPSLLRLYAFLADEADLSGLIAILDDVRADPEQHSAVAEGFLMRTLHEPLLERADDPAVFPFAVRALSSGPADLARLGKLLELRLTAEHQSIWSDAVIEMAKGLDPDELLDADAFLANHPFAQLQLRRQLLALGLQKPKSEATPSDRFRLAARLASLLLELHESTEAYELLSGLHAEEGKEKIRELFFEAAAMSGHYEKAALLRNDPPGWIDLLEESANRDPESAARLKQEIIRRFEHHMTNCDRERLDQICKAPTAP